jgi:hypothetical protein
MITVDLMTFCDNVGNNTFRGRTSMTSATFAKTLAAFIFTAHFVIASGPILLREESEPGRALVPVSQATTQEEPASSSWWGMGHMVSSVKNTVKSLLTLPARKEIPWDQQWSDIVGHIKGQTLEYHKGGFLMADGTAQEIKNNPLTEDEIDRFKVKLESGIDLLEDEDGSLQKTINYVENLGLVEDVHKLKVGGYISLLYKLAQREDTFLEFVDLLSRFYQSIERKNKVLKDEVFFKDGALLARCLWDITKMQRKEEHLSSLKQRVLNFYTDYDGGKLSPYSKKQLNNLGILYFADANRELKSANSSFSYTDAVKGAGLVFLVLGSGFLQGVAAQVTQPAMVATACRGSAIECLSVFGPAVGFGSQISYLLQDSYFNITINDMKQALSSAYIDTRVDISGLRDNGMYAEISSWNNAPSPNITRFLNSNKEFETRQAESSTYTESFLRFFGLGSSSMPLPRSDMNVEDWYRFRKQAPSVDGWSMRRFQFADNGQEHDIHFSEEGDTFAVTHYYQNITSVKPEHKKWIVH